MLHFFFNLTLVFRLLGSLRSSYLSSFACNTKFLVPRRRFLLLSPQLVCGLAVLVIPVLFRHYRVKIVMEVSLIVLIVPNSVILMCVVELKIRSMIEVKLILLVVVRVILVIPIIVFIVIIVIVVSVVTHSDFFWLFVEVRLARVLMIRLPLVMVRLMPRLGWRCFLCFKLRLTPIFSLLSTFLLSLSTSLSECQLALFVG